MKLFSILILFGVMFAMGAAKIISDDECKQRIDAAVNAQRDDILEKREILIKEKEEAKENLNNLQKKKDEADAASKKIKEMEEELILNLQKLNDAKANNANAKQTLEKLNALKQDNAKLLAQKESLQEDTNEKMKQVETMRINHQQVMQDQIYQNEQKLQQLRAETKATLVKEKSELENEFKNAIKNMDEDQKTRDDLRKQREENLVKRLESLTMENANLRYQITLCRRG